MFENQLLERVEAQLSKERYFHSIAAMETAGELARIHGADIQKARIAALLHDCAREFSKEKMLMLSKKYNLDLDEVSLWEKVLIHGPLGAKIAYYEYKVHDNEILDAIECHTTAKKNMTKLDKIMYISDYIEPNRDFDGVEELRRLVLENLDSAVLFALNCTISELINAGRLIHPRTLEARNFMLTANYTNYSNLKCAKMCDC